MNTLTNEDCRSRQAPNTQALVTNTTICAFARRGACHNDIGSPLAMNGTLVGVASWSAPCERRTPEGYTRISEYVTWIQTLIRDV